MAMTRMKIFTGDGRPSIDTANGYYTLPINPSRLTLHNYKISQAKEGMMGLVSRSYPYDADSTLHTMSFLSVPQSDAYNTMLSNLESYARREFVWFKLEDTIPRASNLVYDPCFEFTKTVGDKVYWELDTSYAEISSRYAWSGRNSVNAFKAGEITTPWHFQLYTGSLIEIKDDEVYCFSFLIRSGDSDHHGVSSGLLGFYIRTYDSSMGSLSNVQTMTIGDGDGIGSIVKGKYDGLYYGEHDPDNRPWYRYYATFSKLAGTDNTLGATTRYISPGALSSAYSTLNCLIDGIMIEPGIDKPKLWANHNYDSKEWLKVKIHKVNPMLKHKSQMGRGSTFRNYYNEINVTFQILGVLQDEFL